MKETILSASSPLGLPVTLYKNSWKGGSLGETLVVAGGLHGNDLNGFYITALLTRFLQFIEAGIENHYCLKGKVEIFPVVNTQAAQAGSRIWSFDALDMDLIFPGNENGEIGERLSNTILEQTTDTTLGIILSTPASHYEDYPHFKMYDPDRRLKKTARSLGLEVARIISDLPKTHLLCHWVENDIPSITISGGKANNLDKKYCEKVFTGIVNMMLAKKLLTHSYKTPELSKTSLYTSKNETVLVATQAGLFVPEARTGDLLKPWQKIGAILDIYTGEILEEIISSTEGFLVTLRDYPLVYERETIAILLTKKESRKFWLFQK